MLISKRDQARILRMVKASSAAEEDDMDRQAVATALRAVADKLEAKACLACARGVKAEFLDDLDDEDEELEEDMDLWLDEEDLVEHEHT